MRSVQIGTIVLALAGCSTTQAPPPEPPTSTATDANASSGSADSDSAGDGCVSLVEPQVAADAYTRGKAKLEESHDGEHYLSGPFEEGIGALKIASEQGHRAAQSLYGRTLFAVRFSKQAPTEAEREDYVSSFAFLRIAALRGDAEAEEYLPGIAAAEPAPLEPPFDQIPAEWMGEAFERADAWMACHGATVADRGVE